MCGVGGGNSARLLIVVRRSTQDGIALGVPNGRASARALTSSRKCQAIVVKSASRLPEHNCNLSFPMYPNRQFDGPTRLPLLPVPGYKPTPDNWSVSLPALTCSPL